jgi:hypothetical protein
MLTGLRFFIPDCFFLRDLAVLSTLSVYSGSLGSEEFRSASLRTLLFVCICFAAYVSHSIAYCVRCKAEQRSYTLKYKANRESLDTQVSRFLRISMQCKASLLCSCSERSPASLLHLSCISPAEKCWLQRDKLRLSAEMQQISHELCSAIKEMKRCRDAEMQSCRAAEMQRCRDAEMQRCRDAEMQRCRDAEMQRCRDTLLLNLLATSTKWRKPLGFSNFP